MPLTQQQLEEQFSGVAQALGVEQGDDDYLRGVVHHAAFMYKLISADPPAYFFKFRKSSPFCRTTGWVQGLSPEFTAANVVCDNEAEYLYLSIRDASALSATEIVSVVTQCVEAYAEYFPKTPHYCYACRRSVAMTWLIQAGTAIVTICGPCLEKKAAKAEEVRKEQRASRAAYSLLLPLAFAISAVGWAFFWCGYNQSLPQEGVQIHVPGIAVFLVVAAVGFGLGWPVGTLLKKSGATDQWLPLGVSLTAGVFTVLVGEFLSALWIVYRHIGTPDVGLALRNMATIATGGDVVYTTLKVFFAVALVVAIHQLSAPKKNKLGL